MQNSKKHNREAILMTEEQKTRIRHVDDKSCCSFDGMPMHPHYRYYLICAGFRDLVEIEDKTEQEFIEFINNGKKRDGSSITPHMNNLGATMARNLKKSGIIFREN